MECGYSEYPSISAMKRKPSMPSLESDAESIMDYPNPSKKPKPSDQV